MDTAALPKAAVTLLTNASYLPGALVLLHSLRELHPAPRDFKIVCLVTPETVDARTIGALRSSGYDLVIGVEPIASGETGVQGLSLMGRPDLNLALTKLHIFRLGSVFSTIIYLDADTLPLRPIDSLFSLTEGHRFSACPDIGWPDCFNSGVMVVRPQSSDFEELRGRMTASSDNNGSFDGADQGLLNQYFSEDGPGGQWNRLPFTFNVTPSAAYQYAPAYKHYAHKINLIHFIGPNKPWSNIAHRAASSADVDKTAFDYNSLVDRWYNVYDRNVRLTAAHEPNLAKRFTVPEHIAVWNQARPSAPQHDRLNLVELKEAVEKGVASFQPGQYTSLPLDGRVDLIAPRPPPRPVTQTQSTTSAGPRASGGFEYPAQLRSMPWGGGKEGHDQDSSAHHSPPQSSQPHDVHNHQHDTRHDDQHPQHRHHHDNDQQRTDHHHQPHGGQQHQEPAKQPSPPPQDTWDASKYAPPKKSRPEMIIPMKTVYTPAWDEPIKAQRSYFHTQSTPVHEYPSLPANVQTSDWYKHFTVSTPSQENVQPVFPWEEKTTHRPAPSRSFPKEEKPLPLPPPVKKTLASLSSKTSTPPPPPITIPKTDVLPTRAPPGPPPQRVPPPTFEEAMASYTNAWDDVASIGRYAKRLTLLGIGVDRRNTSGIASTLPSPHSRHQRLHEDDHTGAVSSDHSRDADDEDEDEGAGYPNNALYHDKHAQTEHPRLSDAEVQASPELSPPLSPQDKEVKVTYRAKRGGSATGGSARAARPERTGHTGAAKTGSGSRFAFPHYSFDSTQVSKPSVAPTGRGARVWDPKTDIETRRQDAQHVLSRFVNVGEKGQQ